MIQQNSTEISKYVIYLDFQPYYFIYPAERIKLDLRFHAAFKKYKFYAIPGYYLFFSLFFYKIELPFEYI